MPKSNFASYSCHSCRDGQNSGPSLYFTLVKSLVVTAAATVALISPTAVTAKRISDVAPVLIGGFRLHDSKRFHQQHKPTIKNLVQNAKSSSAHKRQFDTSKPRQAVTDDATGTTTDDLFTTSTTSPTTDDLLAPPTDPTTDDLLLGTPATDDLLGNTTTTTTDDLFATTTDDLFGNTTTTDDLFGNTTFETTFTDDFYTNSTSTDDWLFGGNSMSGTTATACTASQVQNDNCGYKMDGECDAGGFYCDAGTDCYDCDPCRALDNTSCDACTGTMSIGTSTMGQGGNTETMQSSSTTTSDSYECVWCITAQGTGVCSSTGLTEAMPLICSPDGIAASTFFDTCTDREAVTPVCNIQGDTCLFDQDFECDTDFLCNAGSDCFDCDTCLLNTSCDSCNMADGCTWCSDPATYSSNTPTNGFCTSTSTAAAVPETCNAAFATTCAPTAPAAPSSTTSTRAPSTVSAPTSPSSTPPVYVLSPSSSIGNGATCDIMNDTCDFQFNLVCNTVVDASSNETCASGTDCFDCDACMVHVGDCNACVAAGCVYATFPSVVYPDVDIGVCSSPDIATIVPYIAINEGGTSYSSTCSSSSGGEIVEDDIIGVPLDTTCDAYSSSCESCTAQSSQDGDGCMWCSDGISGQCSSADAAKSFPTACGFGTTFVSTCPSSGGETTTDDIFSTTNDDVLAPPSSSVYSCDAAADTCMYPNDGVCDADGFICALNSDCMDCDPCASYRFEGCDGCIAVEGCVWCGADAMCKSAGTTVPDSMMTCTDSDFVSTCSASTTAFFSDPLYDSMVWLYDMVRIRPAWEAGYTGTGIGIRINDDGVDSEHPEFSSKFDVESSCQVSTPSGFYLKNSHGTTCSSLAAGSANDSCSVGMAPDATLSGCRVVKVSSDEELTPEAEDDSYFYVNMEKMHVSSNSYGVPSCQASASRRGLRRLQTTCPFSSSAPTSPCLLSECLGVDWSSPTPLSTCEEAIKEYCFTEFQNDVQACTGSLDLFVQCDYGSQTAEENAALIKGITEGRDGKGIVYVFASGNDYAFGADVNFEGTLNSRFVISVGAVGKDGIHSSYSIGGAALFLSAPGGDSENYTNNLVALAGGGCTEGGVGTSFACPVVSGIVALILQANNELTWRDVQGVLASTSQQIQPDDESWTTNAAGFHHSYVYGFGLVDASAAVNAARTWANFNSELQIIGDSTDASGLSIPEYPNDPVESKITISSPSTFETESVAVYLDLMHASRGDLEITLISPQGTESILAPGERPENAQEVERWKLATVRNWGESANGEWTLRIVDRREGDVSSCVDIAGWTLDIVSEGEPIELTCDLFSRLGACSGGSEGPYFYSLFLGLASDLSDPIFINPDGVSVTEACCACGGGQAASDVTNVLESWQLAVYGHDGTSTAATGSGSAVVVTTTGSSPGGSGGASNPTTTTGAAAAPTAPGSSPSNSTGGGTRGASSSADSMRAWAWWGCSNSWSLMALVATLGFMEGLFN